MKQQENNFEFIPLINLGIYKTHINSFDSKHWTEKVCRYKENNPLSELKSNRGGWQSNNRLQYDSQFFPLCKLILDTMYLLEPNPSRTIGGMWANISSFTNFNSPHNHGLDEYPYKLYSGVIYLKVPPNSGNIVFTNPLSNNMVYHHQPQEGNILFFPSPLIHYVEPNLSQEDRISIAFNFN